MARNIDLIALLPRRMRGRFERLGAYVNDRINDILGEQVNSRLSLTRESRATIQLIVLTLYLEHFFREGTSAARGAVQASKSIKCDGFMVGQSVFRGENENVRRGEMLANRLHRVLANLAKKYRVAISSLDVSDGLDSALRYLVRSFSNG